MWLAAFVTWQKSPNLYLEKVEVQKMVTMVKSLCSNFWSLRVDATFFEVLPNTIRFNRQLYVPTQIVSHISLYYCISMKLDDCYKNTFYNSFPHLSNFLKNVYSKSMKYIYIISYFSCISKLFIKNYLIYNKLNINLIFIFNLTLISMLMARIRNDLH